LSNGPESVQAHAVKWAPNLPVTWRVYEGVGAARRLLIRLLNGLATLLTAPQHLAGLAPNQRHIE